MMEVNLLGLFSLNIDSCLVLFTFFNNLNFRNHYIKDVFTMYYYE